MISFRQINRVIALMIVVIPCVFITLHSVILFTTIHNHTIILRTTIIPQT